MKPVLILIFLLRLSNLFCQTTLEAKIISAIKNADSVILISHKTTNGYMVGKPDEVTIDLPLILNHNINPAIVIKEIKLNNTQKIKLINIINIPDNTTQWTPSKCDEPHNSVLIYKKGKLFYLDICFGCEHLHLSKNLYKGEIDELIMAQKKWGILEKFFKNLGLAYKETE